VRDDNSQRCPRETRTPARPQLQSSRLRSVKCSHRCPPTHNSRHPANAAYPVRRDFSVGHDRLRNTGSPAFAGDDSWVMRRMRAQYLRIQFSNTACPQTQLRDLAAHFARGLLSISLPSHQRAQGMPGAGAPAAARVVVVSTRVSHHEYAGNTRHSPRNGFNGFLRALPGDRACLPPSSAKLLPPT
jgi:hypothetical protein